MGKNTKITKKNDQTKGKKSKNPFISIENNQSFEKII